MIEYVCFEVLAKKLSSKKRPVPTPDLNDVCRSGVLGASDLLFIATRTWRVVTVCEKAAGFWPFQNKIRSGIGCLLLLTLFHSFAIPLISRMLREWGQNDVIVVENMALSMLLYGTSFKVWAAYFYRSTRAKIYKRIVDQLKKLDDEESIIMRSYINYGLKFGLVYIAVVNLATIVFDGPPLCKMVYSMIFSNGTTDKELPYYIDYYGYNDKLLNFIVVHLVLLVVCTVAVMSAYDLSFVIAVQHTCALLNIATRRLRKASEVAAKYRSAQGISTESEREAYHLFATAIDVHNEALQMVNLIDDAYRVAWFVKLIETVFATGALLTMLTVLTKEPYDFVSYSMYLAFTLMQFNVAFNRGQSLVDHAAVVLNACYDSPWDDFSKESATLLRVIMIRSFKVNPLTGGKIFPLTNVTYMNMLRTAFSYFTVISSFVGEEVPTQ